MSQGQIWSFLAVFYGTMALALILSWWKGGAPERAGAALILAAALIQWVLRTLFLPPQFDTLDYLPLAIDIFVFGGFVWIGYFAKRYWPLCAAALQLLAIAGHFARAVKSEVEPWAYALMKSAPTFLIFVTLIVGTALHWRRSRLARQARSFPA